MRWRAAEGDFDIPAGLNPKTQLHEREMVLPQRCADVIRGMAGEDGQGGDTHIHLNVNAADGDSVRRMFMGNREALAATLRQLHRDGQFTGGAFAR